MILDTQAQFSLAQSLAVGTGDTVSSNALDTGATGADTGIGEATTLLVRTPTAVTSGGAGTLQLVVQTDDSVAFGSAREFPLTGALALAAMGTNAILYRGRLPLGLKRFVRLVYRVAGAALTGGSISAGLQPDADLQASYAKNYTIS